MQSFLTEPSEREAPRCMHTSCNVFGFPSESLNTTKFCPSILTLTGSSFSSSPKITGYQKFIYTLNSLNRVVILT